MGLPRFVKHCAAIVVRADKGFVDMVRAMAASILKTLAVWVEREIASGDNPARQKLVVQVCCQLLWGAAPMFCMRDLCMGCTSYSRE